MKEMDLLSSSKTKSSSENSFGTKEVKEKRRAIFI